MERGSAPTERSFSVKKQQKDILVIGFALFAMFFGAGNMIFPPKLGLQTGSQWAVGFLSFTFADAGLALLTILAMIRGTGSLEGITRRVGSWASTLLGVSVFLCLGPLMAIPRTAASTFELGVAPLLNTEARMPFALVFFALVFLLTVRPSKVIDIIGKFLTPALYIALLVMIARGITNPVGSVVDTGASAVFAEGLKAGYQTMDMFGAIIFTVLITATLKERHYEGKNALRVTVFSGIVAAVGLTIVYGGLAYLGATGSGVYEQSIGQTALLIRIMETTMGHGGLILLAIVVALACLTTAIGLTSAAASYFSGLTRGKVSYSAFVTIICVFSAAVSNFGIDTIVSFSSPILTVVYPAVLTLVVLSFFEKKIHNDWVFQFATAGAFVISFLEVLSGYIPSLDFVMKLPLSSLGFGWVLPAAICGLLGALLGKNRGVKRQEAAGE